MLGVLLPVARRHFGVTTLKSTVKFTFEYNQNNNTWELFIPLDVLRAYGARAETDRVVTFDQALVDAVHIRDGRVFGYARVLYGVPLDAVEGFPASLLRTLGISLAGRIVGSAVESRYRQVRLNSDGSVDRDPHGRG